MGLEQLAQVGKRNLFREYNGDREMVARVLAGCLEAVRASLRSCPMREMTNHELKRRTDYCVDLALELRMSAHWSTYQIGDRLTKALEIWLKSGSQFTPDAREFKRTFWAPKAA